MFVVDAFNTEVFETIAFKRSVVMVDVLADFTSNKEIFVVSAFKTETFANVALR